MPRTNKLVQEAAVASLTRAVERLHGAKAHFIGSVLVHEQLQGKLVWRGAVSRFRLDKHPTATGCYAWLMAAEGHEERFHGVLHTPQVNSPRRAVQAALAADPTGVNQR